MKTEQDVIPLEQAIADAKSWQNIAQSKLSENYVKAFLIPMVDFTEILAEGAVNIRAYLGNNSETGEKKLLLVGVDANGNDMINYDAEQFVYDFTTPCPAMCDKKSPLNEPA